MFSVGPIFPEAVHGGSQKILQEVARNLGARGHDVRIVCVRRPDNREPFELGPRVTVLPVLRLKPTYPEPYYTAPFNISDLIVTLHGLLGWCDVFYVHDAELPFHFLYRDRPTVFSFRDFVYPDTLVGGFGFERDRLVLNCEYAARCVIDAFACFRPGLPERVKVIRNGIDLSHFAPSTRGPSEQLLRLLGDLPPATFTLLYPHRPDGRKGLFDALAITAEVAKCLGRRGETVRLLVPVWMDSALEGNSQHEYQTIYGRILARAEELGVRERVHLHRWVPYSLMPDYLSMGHATLSVGNFVETFGNVHLESVACGTASVVARVAAHAYNLPDDLVRRVPYGDIEAAVECVLAAVKSPYDGAGARAYLAENYSFQAMVDGYEGVLGEAQTLEPLAFVPLPPLDPASQVRLAAWCRHDGLGIYNDYDYARRSDGKTIALAAAAEAKTSVATLQHLGFRLDEIDAAIRDGLLVRLATRDESDRF
jgi:glycosyltransferase involved in cell wall biosynthesis